MLNRYNIYNYKHSKKIPSFIISLVICFAFLFFSSFLSLYLSYKIQEIFKFEFSSPLVFSVFELAIPFASIILLVILWVFLVEKNSLISIGLNKKKALKNYFRGFLIGIFMIISCVLVMSLLGYVNSSNITFSLNIKTVTSVLILLGGWVIQGASEEILLRGYLLPRISQRYNLLIGIIISSTIFAVLHMSNNYMTLISYINLVLFGFLAAIYVIYEKSIWGICALHSSWNFAQGNIFGFAVSGTGVQDTIMSANMSNRYRLLTGGDFGIEGGLICTFVLLLVLLYIVRKIYISNKHNRIGNIAT